MFIEVVQGIIKILEVERDIVPTIEVVMPIIHEVVRDMEGIIIIITIEEVAIEIKIIIEIGVDHLKDRAEIGEMAGVQVKAGVGQVLEQVETEIGFDALNVESTITLHENVQLDKPDNLVGKLNKYSRCLIWMKIRH